MEGHRLCASGGMGKAVGHCPSSSNARNGLKTIITSVVLRLPCDESGIFPAFLRDPRIYFEIRIELSE